MDDELTKVKETFNKRMDSLLLIDKNYSSLVHRNPLKIIEMFFSSYDVCVTKGIFLDKDYDNMYHLLSHHYLFFSDDSYAKERHKRKIIELLLFYKDKILDLINVRSQSSIVHNDKLD